MTQFAGDAAADLLMGELHIIDDDIPDIIEGHFQAEGDRVLVPAEHGNQIRALNISEIGQAGEGHDADAGIIKQDRHGGDGGLRDMVSNEQLHRFGGGEIVIRFHVCLPFS